ncbi:hypothetical protein BLNAU_14087 [Blattamonas nauphoetae]|uniref:Uncharacterized protein n=1 Tax=Blattamonas nauphoetae TaxID=2049346 RepID=A0ABQ9XJL8_9EUKA|nr:hypothetical protein BLNAU_14087 [Blattamonas nauphoetae]
MNKPFAKRFSLPTKGPYIPLCLSIDLRTITTLPLASRLFESVLEVFKGKPELNEWEVFRIVKVLKSLDYFTRSRQFNSSTWPPPSLASDGSYTTLIQAMIPFTTCKYPGIVYEALRLSETALYRLSHGKKLDCIATGFLTPFQGTHPDFATFPRSSMYCVMSLIAAYFSILVDLYSPIPDDRTHPSSKQIVKRIFTQIVKPFDPFLRSLFLRQTEFREDQHNQPFYELISFLIVAAPFSNVFTQFLVSRPLCLMWMTCMNLSTRNNAKWNALGNIMPRRYQASLNTPDTKRRRKEVMRQLREEGFEEEVCECLGWMGRSSLDGVLLTAQRILIGLGGNVPRDKIVPDVDGDETDEEEREGVGEEEMGEEEGAGTKGKKKKKTRRRRKWEKTKNGRKEMMRLQESRKE